MNHFQDDRPHPMGLYEDKRPHPLGITYNAEWEVTLTRRADLYLAERARRNERPKGLLAALAVMVTG